MLTYDAIIIGYGKAGKTLAKNFADKDWEVAMVEKDPRMYGGTCINIACIPTKLLAHDSTEGNSYKDAIKRKNDVVEQMRLKNFNMLNDLEKVTIYESEGKFLSNNEVEIALNGQKEVLTAEHIFINTGSHAFIPPLEGDTYSNKLFTSTTLLDQKKLPGSLAIVGGGYIGLEFASIYQNFGSQVTVITPDEQLLPNEEPEVAENILYELKQKGIQFVFDSKALKVTDKESEVTLGLSNEEEVTAEAALLATGRKPNTEGLRLEKTDIELTDDGAIKVDENLQSTVNHVWALGDVKGGMQFTYISLDDYRIIMNQLFGEADYSLSKRRNVPYSIFIDPPFSRVGLTEKEAKEKGYDVTTGTMPVSSHPRANVIDDKRGFFKAVMDNKSEKILGATLFGPESPELINLVKTAMDLDVPYTFLRDQIYIHPTMTEAFNNLFA